MGEIEISKTRFGRVDGQWHMLEDNSSYPAWVWSPVPFLEVIERLQAENAELEDILDQNVPNWRTEYPADPDREDTQ